MIRLTIGLVLFLVASCFVLLNALLIAVAIGDVIGIVIAGFAAAIPALGFVFLWLRLDRYEHEPLTLVALAFFWGAAVATILSIVISVPTGIAIGLVLGPELEELLGAGLVAPIVEETFKGIAVLLLVLIFRREFDNVLDGILYGSLVGFGFAMTENILYLGTALAENGLVAFGVLFYLRIVLGGFGHAIYTGTTGAGIGIWRERRDVLGVLLAVLCFGVAIGQHAAWNTLGAMLLPALVGDSPGGALFLAFIGFPLAVILIEGPGFLFLMLLAWWTTRRERTIIRRYLAPELASGLLTQAEYDVIGSGLRRSLSHIDTLFRTGPAAWLRRRQLHQLATELAFSRYHRDRGEFRDTGPRDEAFYRGRIAQLQGLPPVTPA